MDEDDILHQNDDGNRAFLQAFLARGTMTFKEAQSILAAIFTAQVILENGEGAEPTAVSDVTREDFESYVSAASAAASPFDMEIRSTTHQVTRERVWALVNTTSDAVTQLATLLSAEEMAFVRRVIDAMFDKYNTPRMEMLCLDGMQANKLRTIPRADANPDETQNGDNDETQTQTQTQTSGLKGLKPTEVERVMRVMVDAGWFERSRAGFYSLSPRALLELRSWLTDAYNDSEEGAWQRVKFCAACREVVTCGQRCAERDCLVRLHDACAEAFWRGNRNGGAGGRACPQCKKEWTGRHFVGERAVTETEAYQRGRRRSGRGGRNSIVEQIVDEAEAEAEAEEEGEEEGEGEGEGEEDEDEDEE
ncbi:Nse1 non-SMC component of SMC5-6 complex-domain-containing protein [Hypoxylon cercidicola]|nr:Nse1 non-SMC component of SMC5-6 complex-domain-containing protein [Hypoxylon cercidicola]